MLDTVTSPLNASTGKDTMKVGNGGESRPCDSMDMETARKASVPTAETASAEPTIGDLQAVAEEFTAAFHTALYELEASRKLVKERTARLDELNEAITTLNASLQAEIGKARSKDEEHARERDALNQRILELESERDRLRQQAAEQETSLNEQADKISNLAARLGELGATLDQHKADSLRAAEQFAREREESNDKLTSLTQTINHQEEAHRQESTRLHAEIQTLDDALRKKEERLEQGRRELDARDKLIASLNDQISGLEDELRAQSEKMQADAVSHARVCAELNDRISSIAGDYGSLQAIHDELAAHAGKLENLNRALHESSISENGVHRKIIEEKDALIAALQARLEAAKQTPMVPTVDTRGDGELKAALTELETRLKESESQARMFAERARVADQLEAQLEQLRRELEENRKSGGGNDTNGLALKTPQGPVIELEAAPEKAKPSETSRPADARAIPAQNPDTGPSALITARERFIAHLNDLLAKQGGSGARHTIMYVLLDNFIRVRDEIGVMNSEQVVDEICAIIESHCDGNDKITRFGDCTFAVLCSDTSSEETRTKAERIRSTIENQIFEAAGRSLVTTTSIGVCALRGSDSSAEQVISRADLACESARLSGGNQVLVNSAVADELCLPESHGRHAEIIDRVLGENRITIYYQPISNLKDNSSKWFEVLTRVVDANSAIILPGEFFSMAGNSGKARDVDRYVIESIMKMLAENPDSNMKLFIKLTRQSVSDHDLPLWIMDRIREYGIDPGQLVFEVAERVLENEVKNLSMLSGALNKIGCEIAIEHYRLTTQPQHLQHIQADYLKIDSTLVQDIGSRGESLTKITDIMDLARNNGLLTIAEGVESPACLAILWELGVNFAQGYLISEPAVHTNFEIEDVNPGQNQATDGKATYTLGL